MTTLTKNFGWIVLALAGGMVGCAGEAVGGASDELLLDDGGSLDSIDDGTWRDALAGCEGLLDGGEHFAIASAEAELVAAVAADGRVVCVDTVTAVEEELTDTGHPEEADDLVDAFYATLAAIRATEVGPTRFGDPNRPGDPDPEPNIDENRFRLAGDPDPEPNSGA